jgi:hypothetical protein
MKLQTRYILGCMVAAGMTVGMSGWIPSAGASEVAAESAVQSATATAPHYFLVHTKEGRLWAFGDAKTYLMYMEHGEVALTRARIGVGPQGQTVVFGITSDDVKNNQPSMGEMFFDGKVTGGAEFYGEIVRGGRYHVFGEWQDFRDYMQHGEVILTFTEIGTGPKGETVIYALNKTTAKDGRPVKLIEKFKNLRGMK